MNGAKPEGGEWNFDKDNRLPPPKNYTWPQYLEHERDEIDLQVVKELNYQPKKYWATTRQGALKQLDNFLKNHFATFGPYEDAIRVEFDQSTSRYEANTILFRTVSSAWQKSPSFCVLVSFFENSCHTSSV